MRLREALNERDGLRRVDEKKKEKKSDVVIALEVVEFVEGEWSKCVESNCEEVLESETNVR